MEKKQKGIEGEGVPQGDDKTASDYRDAVETSHYKQSAETSAGVRVTQQLCCSMSKSLKTTTLMIILMIIGGLLGAAYVYKAGPGFMGIVPESYGRKSYVDLAAEVKNFGWLWHSHNLFVAVTEDDPTFLEKSHMGRDGDVETGWEFFRRITTTVRMKGFLKIIYDGQHPNLEVWYGRCRGSLTELEQLRQQNLIRIEQTEELSRLREQFLEEERFREKNDEQTN